MKTPKEILAHRLGSMIGPGLRFHSAKEMAQKAINRGYGTNLDSLTRNINRIRKQDTDPQLSTLQAIAAAIGVSVAELFDGTGSNERLSNEIQEAIDLLRLADSAAPLKRELLLNTIKLALPNLSETTPEKRHSK